MLIRMQLESISPMCIVSMQAVCTRQLCTGENFLMNGERDMQNGLNNSEAKTGNGYLDARMLMDEGYTCIPMQNVSYLDAKMLSMIQSYKQHTGRAFSLKTL